MQTVNKHSALNIGLTNWWFSDVDLINNRQANFKVNYIDAGLLNFPKAITISAWFCGSEGTLVSNYSSDGHAAQFDLSLSPDGAVIFTIQSGQGIYRIWSTAIDTFSSDAWYYVQVTHDGNFNVQIIINDRISPLFYFSTPGMIIPTIPYSAGNTSIGRAGSFNGAYFQGQFRDIRLYNQPVLDNNYYYESLLGNPTTLEREDITYQVISTGLKLHSYIDNIELDEIITTEVGHISERIVYFMASGHDYRSLSVTSTDNKDIRSYTFVLDPINLLSFKIFLNYNRFETLRIIDQGNQYIGLMINSDNNNRSMDITNINQTLTVDINITFLS
jgi:hypothetical protein